jgi:ABC-type branched-subunit amino acid transport system substrate-binding protein
MTVRQTLIYTGMMSSDDFKVPSADSLDQKISSIDGVFLPTSQEDLALIVPNIQYYNISGKFYGTRNLANADVLRNNNVFARNFYFISDYYIDKSSQHYRQVANDFVKITGDNPDRFSVYGYDTMEFLLMAFGHSNRSREDIRAQLMNLPVYHGIGRSISFKGNQPGSNSCAFILNYHRGNEILVAKVEEGKIIFRR